VVDAPDVLRTGNLLGALAPAAAERIDTATDAAAVTSLVTTRERDGRSARR
jgi:hypothetical protein